jgi:phytoene dehydrogenase-like protein
LGSAGFATRILPAQADVPTLPRLLQTDQSRRYRKIEVGEANFKLVRSYPHFYHLRWHMLMYYAALFERRGGRTEPETDLTQAKQHLERVIHFDSEAGNDYGVLRARLLALLLRAVTEPLSSCEREMVELKPRMAERGYGFEAKLLGHLIERRGVTPEELRSIFRFYPFVHQ